MRLAYIRDGLDAAQFVCVMQLLNQTPAGRQTCEADLNGLVRLRVLASNREVKLGEWVVLPLLHV
jgi:hypothetical protein